MVPGGGQVLDQIFKAPVALQSGNVFD